MAQPTLEDLGLAPSSQALLDEAHARRIVRTLDLTDEVLADGTLPLTWIWAWFTPTTATADLRTDGHPAGRQDGALAGLDRRMFVGGRLERHHDVRLGVATDRTSEVLSADAKQGSTGAFVVVDVEHRYHQDGTTVLTERQQLMYRAAPTTPVPPVGAASAEHGRGAAHVVVPDERLLFRFSALTFNTHRIHYDLPYATGTEGYPGLVVHGPLTATLLAGVAERAHGRPLERFRFRATAPTFASVPLALHAEATAAGATTLRAVRADGIDVMTAEAA